MLAAAAQNGRCLRFASAELRGTAAFMKAAVALDSHYRAAKSTDEHQVR